MLEFSCVSDVVFEFNLVSLFESEVIFVVYFCSFLVNVDVFDVVVFVFEVSCVVLFVVFDSDDLRVLRFV